MRSILGDLSNIRLDFFVFEFQIIFILLFHIINELLLFLFDKIDLRLDFFVRFLFFIGRFVVFLVFCLQRVLKVEDNWALFIKKVYIFICEFFELFLPFLVALFYFVLTLQLLNRELFFLLFNEFLEFEDLTVRFFYQNLVFFPNFFDMAM